MTDILMAQEKTSSGEIRTPILGGSRGVFLLEESAAGHAEMTSNASMPALASIADIQGASAHSGFWPDAGSYMAQYRPYNVTKNGVLVIPIRGVLYSDFSWSFEGWAVGYTYIQEALKRGAADPDVKAIVLDMNSPGGDVSGCDKTGKAVQAARKMKPVLTAVNEMACSAAMWLASQSAKIVCEDSGITGSVGVITRHRDISGMMSNAGIKITPIFAGEHKDEGSPYKPLDEKAKANIQRHINTLYGKFCATVATGRGISADAVKATEAAIFMGEEGLKVGFIDAIGTLEETIEMAVTAATSKGAVMDANDTNKTNAQAAVPTPVAGAAAAAPVSPDGQAAAPAAVNPVAEAPKVDARAEERQRIAAIMNSDAGKANAAQATFLAYETDMSAEQAIKIMNAGATAAPAAPVDPAPAQTGASAAAFQAAMSGTPNPSITPEANGAGEMDRATAAIAALKRFDSNQ